MLNSRDSGGADVFFVEWNLFWFSNELVAIKVVDMDRVVEVRQLDVGLQWVLVGEPTRRVIISQCPSSIGKIPIKIYDHENE